MQKWWGGLTSGFWLMFLTQMLGFYSRKVEERMITRVKFSMELAELLKNKYSSRKRIVLDLVAKVNGHDLVRVEGRT